MDVIKIATTMYRKVNPQGIEQFVSEFLMKDGRRATEIISKLDDAGNKAIRIIERDFIGYPEKVIDEVSGTKKVYVPAYPEREKGVFEYTEDNVKNYFPNISFESLCEY